MPEDQICGNIILWSIFKIEYVPNLLKHLNIEKQGEIREAVKIEKKGILIISLLDQFCEYILTFSRGKMILT